MTSANWVGGVVPAPGDDLVFPTGAFSLNSNPSNDFPAGTSFNSITIQDVNYLLAGAPIILVAGISAPNGGHALLPITLAASQSFSAATNGLFVGAVDLNGKTLTLSANGGLGVAGNISGSGTIIKEGSGGWVFSGNNTFAGQLVINGGVINCFSASALGVTDNTLANGTIVNAGGTLILNGVDPTRSEYIRLFGSGNILNGVGALHTGSSQTVAGTVELADANAALTGGTFTFNGVVTGAGRLVLHNQGTFILTNPANDFAGGVAWIATPFAATLTLGASHVLPSYVTLDVISGGTFNVNGMTQTIASLSGAGATDLGSGGALTITNPTGTYSGGMGGSGSVVMSGGTSTWSGANTYSGTFTHTAGTFTLNGGSLSAALTQSGGTFVVSGAATTGNLMLAAASTYATTLNSILHVSGTVSLGGAALALSGSGSGSPITLIDNDGADGVTGTFAGLPEGAAVSAGGSTYTISYHGGTGNDVVLTLAPPTPPDVTFIAAPSTIPRGRGSATLSWTTANAASVVIDGFGAQPLNGSLSVTPSQTTTYMLTATGPGGTTVKQATVTVSDGPAVFFGALPDVIGVGQTATLSWSAQGATSVVIDPGLGPQPAEGSTVVSPLVTTTYHLTATDASGTSQATATVTVIGRPEVTFNATPQTILPHQSATLSWSTKNAASLSIDHGIGTVGPTGTMSVAPLTTTTYTITATGIGGTTTTSVKVTVTSGRGRVVSH